MNITSRSLRLGLFLCATMLILGIGIFLIGSNNLIFHSTYRLSAQFPNVSGLGEGADVRVGGIREGTVKRILLPNSPDGKVTVLMDLENSTRGAVRQDSTAYIQSEGLLGDRYVEVSFGSKNAPAVQSGQTIRSEPPLEISDLVKKTNQILDSANDAMRNVEGTTDNLKSISAKIEHGEGTVGALINDKSIYNQAQAGAAAFQEDMEALKHNFLLRGFFRKRGYEDPTALTKDSVSQLPGGRALKTFSYDAKTLFDQAKLKNHNKLNEAGQFLERNQFGLAVAAATMGAKGDSEKGRQLTEARAAAARDYLVQNFRMDDMKVKTIALGKGEATNDDGSLEIIVYPPSTTSGSRTPAEGRR